MSYNAAGMTLFHGLVNCRKVIFGSTCHRNSCVNAKIYVYAWIWGTLNTWPLGTEKDSIFTQNAKLVLQSLNNVHLVCAVCMNLVVGGEFMYNKIV